VRSFWGAESIGLKAADDDCHRGGRDQTPMTTVIAPRYAVLMDARQQTLRTRGSGEQQPTRDRIVRSAAALVRERGVHGVGLRQIVAHADGPRGSLQRYFPGGKTQLITEALKLVGAEVLDDTESGLNEAATLADAIDAIFAPWRHVLVESNFTMGCPIAATVIDASGDDRLRQEARALLDAWRDSVHAALVKFGVQQSTAEDDATALLAALEGALILSRANQSIQPLDTVQRFFTTSLTQPSANPAAPPP
jgi:TetR/AcrR family transcriptional repressor of lmrAB and yxaGH operons